jgi:hypothetical protein
MNRRATIAEHLRTSAFICGSTPATEATATTVDTRLRANDDL